MRQAGKIFGSSFHGLSDAVLHCGVCRINALPDLHEGAVIVAVLAHLTPPPGPSDGEQAWMREARRSSPTRPDTAALPAPFRTQSTR